LADEAGSPARALEDDAVPQGAAVERAGEFVRAGDGGGDVDVCGVAEMHIERAGSLGDDADVEVLRFGICVRVLLTESDGPLVNVTAEPTGREGLPWHGADGQSRLLRKNDVQRSLRQHFRRRSLGSREKLIVVLL
jgi:hypothetical protein